MSVQQSSTAVAPVGEIRRSWLERAWRRLKADRRFGRFVPRTLFGRAMLIFVLPLVTLQALSAWWFYEQHWDNVTSRLSRAALLEQQWREVPQVPAPDAPVVGAGGFEIRVFDADLVERVVQCAGALERGVFRAARDP